MGSRGFDGYFLGQCVLSGDLLVCKWEVRLYVCDGMLGLCIYAKEWELCLYFWYVVQVFLSIWGM